MKFDYFALKITPTYIICFFLIRHMLNVYYPKYELNNFFLQRMSEKKTCKMVQKLGSPIAFCKHYLVKVF